MPADVVEEILRLPERAGGIVLAAPVRFGDVNALTRRLPHGPGARRRRAPPHES